MKRLLSIFCLLSLCSGVLCAQSTKDFEKRYEDARERLRNGDYEEAMFAFKDVCKKNDNNRFQEYAHYFCGLSAYKAKKYQDARFILKKLESDYSDWEKMEEAYVVLAMTLFAEDDLVPAIRYCGKVVDKKIRKDVEAMERKLLWESNDLDQIKLCQNDFPNDVIVAEILAHKLNRGNASLEDKFLVQYLIQDYGFNPDDFPNAGLKKSEKKSSYQVAVMLPFDMHGTAVLKSARFYELFAGIELAVDTLQNEGVDIELFVYDTKKDTGVVHSLLELPEMSAMDLLVGPLYPQTSILVSKYAQAHQINYLNPLSYDSGLIDHNANAYLYHPTHEQIGEKAALFALDSFEVGGAVIFYGESQKDSLVAAAYKYYWELAGREVVIFEQVGKSTKTLGKQIKKAKTAKASNIFVYSLENLVAASLMSALEINDADIPVIAPAKWLDIQLITFEQYQRRKYYFIYPDYINAEDELVTVFRDKFQEHLNVRPAKYRHAYVGYEAMLFWGRSLGKYGNLGNEGMAKEGYVQGGTLFGVDYSKGNFNRLVPIMRLSPDYFLRWVNPPKKYVAHATNDK